MAKEEKTRVPKRPIWTGTITIGLVNVPVKVYPMIYDKSFTFRFLHKQDGQPLKYQKVCTKDDKVIPWEDIARGYEIAKGRYIMFQKEELETAKPESDQRIRINKFVDYLSVDPVYYDKSYILAPDKNNDAYSLLLAALQKTGKAGAGRITLRTKEYPALVHAYKRALILTTLRYVYEVVAPSQIEELGQIKESKKEELDLAKKIVADLSGEFDITEYKDTFKEKIEELIKKKAQGQTLVVEKAPQKEEAKELMVALQETLRQLKQK